MKLFKIELNKYLLTKWSLISLVLASAIFIFTMYTSINEQGIIYLVEIFIGLSYTKKLFIVAITIPLARLYVDDVNNKYLNYVINRTSIKRYSLNKVLVSFLGAFILSIGSFGIVVFIFSLIGLPIYSRIDLLRLNQYSYYVDLIENGHTIFILFIYVWNYSLSVAFWNTTGLLFSSYLPNNFIPYISPFVISYYVEEFALKLPNMISIYSLGRSSLAFPNQPIWVNQLYVTAFFLVLTGTVGYLFYRQIKRKVPYA
ncbi:hypothetical protein [Fundicoccus culcitae]|uniref:ABC-2 family transporter protein n=1 Tax=Fundicoccus culcitae TaxID=2969821 RepID=A0ABY5P6I1_9LACT|nr:hypothetical protein [Fundicoccus culcitae]UUX34343.1 hypothetical protein NRE15_01455 [Fundicoccus culcitae]